MRPTYNTTYWPLGRIGYRSGRTSGRFANLFALAKKHLYLHINVCGYRHRKLRKPAYVYLQNVIGNCSKHEYKIHFLMDNDVNESIKREAYTKALKFKNTGLDAEAIYARLEKQGVPEDIAREVAKNVAMHKQTNKDSLTPNPLNTFSVWAKIVNTIFPKIKL